MICEKRLLAILVYAGGRHHTTLHPGAAFCMASRFQPHPWWCALGIGGFDDTAQSRL